MVSIRLQRTGRRRHAQFRVVVQDSHRAPTSGRVIANLGFYNPHTKEHGVDLEKAAVYLQNGAQPSERMVKFFIDNKVDLPAWVKQPKQKAKSIRHPDKLRRNRPPETPAAVEETTPAATETEADPAEEKTAEAAEPEAPATDDQGGADAQAEEETETTDEAEETGGKEADKPEAVDEEEEPEKEEDGGGDESEEEKAEQRSDAE